MSECCNVGCALCRHATTQGLHDAKELAKNLIETVSHYIQAAVNLISFPDVSN